MGEKYINQSDCHRRLDDTVCFYDKIPVYVMVDKDAPTGSIAISNRWVPPHITKIIKTTDPLFTAVHPPLGFVNTPLGDLDYTLFIKRMAVRKFKQGLCKQNLTYNVLNDIAAGAGFSTRTTGFFKMLQNSYPSFDEVMEKLLKSEVRSNIAYHKHFAVVREEPNLYVLYYKTSKIGRVDPTTKTYNLMFVDSRTYSFINNLVTRSGISYASS